MVDKSFWRLCRRLFGTWLERGCGRSWPLPPGVDGNCGSHENIDVNCLAFHLGKFSGNADRIGEQAQTAILHADHDGSFAHQAPPDFLGIEQGVNIALGWQVDFDPRTAYPAHDLPDLRVDQFLVSGQVAHERNCNAALVG